MNNAIEIWGPLPEQDAAPRAGVKGPGSQHRSWERNTEVAALRVFFTESLSSVRLQTQTESLVGRTGCHLLYSSKYLLYSNTYQTVSSCARQHSTGMYVLSS